MIKNYFYFFGFLSLSAIIFIMFQNEFVGNFARNEIRWYLFTDKVRFTDISFYEFAKNQYKNNYSLTTNSFYKYNIFFVETNRERSIFSDKQLCAVESAAFNNPSSLILIEFFKLILNKISLKFFDQKLLCIFFQLRLILNQMTYD